MVDRGLLLSGLQRVVSLLEKDLAERSDLAEVPEVGETLRVEYDRAQRAERTALSYGQWRADYATQVAVAWVLGAVFARFLEDNGLVESPRLAGPGDGLQRARDEHELYFRAHPTETDRDYLLAVFRELGRLPGMGAIFLDRNPLFELPNWLSGDAAGVLLRFFQTIDSATGTLVHDFTDSAWDTRFLGDLYQDLSKAARKKYALLQTPIFVEEFILDRTLDPAIEEFGLQDFRTIDPACGSGHFLLGAFERILDRWQRKEPGTYVRALAQRALDAVHGVDVNPYAIAIARFRLLLAAMRASGITKLKNAPGFKFNLACGDSLLHGEGSQLVLGDWAPMSHHFQTEDIAALNGILRGEYYHAVVANPPYIVPRDKALNAAYRERYEACHRQYSLAVPFMERIFGLAVKGGFTGQITANSFMKREFGKKLIETFFPKVDLTHVIDTSGAYIPGHGTPTVILFGRNRAPVASVIRTVMGIRGEPSTPEDAAQGLVWSAITEQVDVEGSESEFVSVADSQRELFHKHPWSIGGGGATELKTAIEKLNIKRLKDVIETICSLCLTRADDTYLMPNGVLPRRGIKPEHQLVMIQGEHVRDWGIYEPEHVLFPYNEELKPVSEEDGLAVHHFLWPHKENLWRRRELGGDHRELNRTWWEWNRFLTHRFRNPRSIAFAFVATHNHFVLDRGGKVFKQSAPVIKLPEGATEDEHLGLLGLLNSAIGCFWMQQVFHNKGGPGGASSKDEKWHDFYEFDGTKLKQFPIPKQYSLRISSQINELAGLLDCYTPAQALGLYSKHKDLLKDYREKRILILQKMISLQEELDWESYQSYGLLQESPTSRSEPPPIDIGQRAFEIVMARQMRDGKLQTKWFERLNAVSIIELPIDWPESYKKVVQERISLIEKNKNIRLIEQTNYKRRWNTEPWDSQLERALQTWLLNRIESYFDFDGRMNDDGIPTAKLPDPTLISTAKLADITRQDPDLLQVGELYRNDPAFNLQKLIDELIDKQTVPLLPILRYKDSGLRKRQDWQHTWALQRQEDTIDARTHLSKNDPNHLDSTAAKRQKEQDIGTIPVPPKYATKDFTKTHYWKLRGKLDVPKERWVSFPHCEGPDSFPVIAWAGYNHLQLTQAISIYYIEVKENFGGRDDPRLLPLLSCLLELLPWLKQWHNDLDPTYNLKMGDYYEGFIQDEARQMDKTLDELRAWKPPKTQGKQKRKRQK
ncbi:BREX-2 system adenine-specific DNA-methyltransferase PglX [Synechococcus sp. PCC 7336]|uniref:BREX-2 system adenine-specific DNA-methyltransferase PglX n=1 Tax=Synechococcus sp. PCC 7336 TaxID=195250 RepID=UPI00034D5754|nr:BREX-2 system adenine-specific DNA-methyltransferase PglX [Synechococcus sp. PCC 7336]